MEKSTNDNKQDLTELMYLFHIGLFFSIWYLVSSKKKEPYITTRKALTKQYDIDLKTFNKWIQLFSDSETHSYTTFSKQHGLTQRQYDYLIELFGSPMEGETKYSKFDIVASDEEGIGHNDYRDVRKSIEQWPDKGIVSHEKDSLYNTYEKSCDASDRLRSILNSRLPCALHPEEIEKVKASLAELKERHKDCTEGELLTLSLATVVANERSTFFMYDLNQFKKDNPIFLTSKQLQQ